MGAKSLILLSLLVWHGQASAQPQQLALVEKYSIGSFQRAIRIVCSAQGTLYALDADLNKVYAYADLTQPPKSIGGFGWSTGSFDKPTGIATDGINVYIADYGNHRIQRFDRNLNYVSSFSTRDTSDAALRFGYPLDVALSELGDLFVLDGENLRILKFNPQNFYERTMGDVNSGKGKLQNPIKLFATTSRIIVGEHMRVVVFDYFGNYMRSIGEGIVSALTGFAVCKNGFIMASSDTIWLYSQDGDLMNTTPLNHLMSSERIERIQDVACSGDQIFILSPHKIHVFTMND
jgi:DNA-binding beta-propeller fold protein YncE